MKFKIYVQPGAKKFGYSGLHDGIPKIKITAPPVDGAANSEIIKFFSKLLSISKNQIEIINGLSSRIKTLEIDLDISYEDIISKLEKF